MNDETQEATAVAERQQVELTRKACSAARNEWPHDAHIFHLKRYALDTTGKATPDSSCQPFFSYFWCAGLEAQP